ncbi:tocopherol cyclase family protein [Rhodococcus sp. CH91]|uniref:tocopherol cyclase family protein n=1 Tax=Rhodococcus sp. CH91 TaxID=2910256 RepID=UPI001F4AF8D6|nr:tocopherol cyclase family protein [Rhodococcus sp. CH91]
MNAYGGFSPKGLWTRYRASGADLPFGDPLAAHDVAMEGYFWRFTQPETGRVVIALCGVNRADAIPAVEDAPDPAGTGPRWATLGLAAHPGGFLRTTAHPMAAADPGRLGASAGDAFRGDSGRVWMDLGDDARLDVRVSALRPWPRRRFGASSVFHSVPALNQYWHSWLLGGEVEGYAILGDEKWDLTGSQVYGEKNWGKGGFPESWWWGQAQGFADARACVAFAGGQVHSGPLRTEVTAVVVALPDGRVVRLGNPVTSPVHATVTDESWVLRGRNARWSVEISASSPIGAAHVLPVPLPAERRNVAGSIEHLGGSMKVTVRERGRLAWEDESSLAALEHGGLDRARAELDRRGAAADATDAPPVV